MKLRFWVGVGLIAVAAGLLAYRGRITGYVVEKLEQRKLPRPIPASQFLGGQAPAVGLNNNFVIPSESAALGDPRPLDGREESHTDVRAPHPNPLPQGERELPVEFNLAVPFTVQAPYAVWDAVHEDACEEASVMMVDAFYDGRVFTQDNAEHEIQDNVQWQTDVLGHWENTTAEETVRILKERYGYVNVQIVYDPTIEMIKREVAQGRPVILPAAGRLLGNRYYTPPGPLYHMLVVRGWTKDGMIITNDPGTKRGEGYLYKPDVLMNAVHDWNGGDVGNGKKVMIIVEK